MALDNILDYAKDLRTYDKLDKDIKEGKRRESIALEGLVDWFREVKEQKATYKIYPESIWSPDKVRMTRKDADLFIHKKDKTTEYHLEVKVALMPIAEFKDYWYLRPSGIHALKNDPYGIVYMSTPKRFCVLRASAIYNYPIRNADHWGGKQCYAIPKKEWLEKSKLHIKELDFTVDV